MSPQEHIAKVDSPRGSASVHGDTFQSRSVKVMRGYEKVLYACIFITKSVPAENMYKRHLDDDVVRALARIKDISASAGISRETLEHARAHVSRVDGYAKALAVAGVVKSLLYTFVHGECARLSREVDALLTTYPTSLDELLVVEGFASMLEAADEEGGARQSLSTAPAPSAVRAQTSVPATVATAARPLPPAHTRSPAPTPQTRVPVQARSAHFTTASRQPRPPRDSSRGEEVYVFIQQHGTVGIPQLAAKFTGISSKTIQRELVSLVQAGRIVKEGDRRWTQYSLPAAS